MHIFMHTWLHTETYVQTAPTPSPPPTQIYLNLCAGADIQSAGRNLDQPGISDKRQFSGLCPLYL